jgi:hypothetical protein
MPSHDSIRSRGNHAPVFLREGDYWTIAYDAVVVRIKDANELRYLEPLLRHPGTLFTSPG